MAPKNEGTKTEASESPLYSVTSLAAAYIKAQKALNAAELKLKPKREAVEQLRVAIEQALVDRKKATGEDTQFGFKGWKFNRFVMTIAECKDPAAAKRWCVEHDVLDALGAVKAATLRDLANTGSLSATEASEALALLDFTDKAQLRITPPKGG